MAQELGGSQISALLETVPGIASVLRSPVADAVVGTVRAAAGKDEFRLDHARELAQFAVRRGLIGVEEAESLIQEVSERRKRRSPSKKGVTRRPKPKARAKKVASRKKTKAAGTSRKPTRKKR